MKRSALSYLAIGLIPLVLLGWFAWPRIYNLIWPTSHVRLIDAISRGDRVGVERALDSGANVDGKPESLEFEGVSPLGAAAEQGELEIARLLLDRGADVNMADGWCISPLTAAAEHGNTEIVKLLVKRGARVNDSPGGSYALWRACVEDKVDSVITLLDAGANPNTTMNDGEPLIKAVRSFKHARIEALLRKAGAKD